MSRVGSSGSSRPSARCGPAALSALSDRELLARVKALVLKERATSLEILVHLIEVECRKLHLILGYPSLFEYCTRHLGYSSSAAGRRIRAARCVRDFPEVYGLLEKNEVNLSSVSLVASILTAENKDDLLGRIRNRSQKEVEGIVADYRPPVSFRDRARPVCVAVVEPAKRGSEAMQAIVTARSRSGSGNSPNVAAGCAAGQTGPRTETQPLRISGNNASDVLRTQPPSDAAQNPTPRIERKLLVQFLASEAFMKKFEKARALLSNRLGKPSYEAVLETALDEFLAKHDPENRKQRREERQSKTNPRIKPIKHTVHEATRKQMPEADPSRGTSEKLATGGAAPRARCPAADPTLHPGITTAHEHSRHIPAAIRDAVFAQDKGRCTYTGADGRRCGATHNLQIDHIVPFARGGMTSVENLRLLCGKHNRLRAERVFGPRRSPRVSPPRVDEPPFTRP